MRRQPHHASRQEPEPFATLPLLAPLEEQLMSKAHTEHRGAGASKPAHRVTKPGIAQCARGDCERAHPGSTTPSQRAIVRGSLLITGCAPATWSARSTLRTLPTP